MNKKDFLILTVILIVAVAFRLYKINTPIADYNSQYQVNAAAVGKNFITNGFNLLLPRYDELSSTASGLENPEGYRFTEFPLYSAIPAFFYKYLPITTYDVYARSTTIFFSLIIISILYYFGLKLHSRTAGIFAALIYAAMPYFVFYSRVVLPDTMAVALMLTSIWLLYLYFQSKSRNPFFFFTSIGMYSLAILTQPLTFFYTIVVSYLFVSTYLFDVFKKWQFYIFPLLGLLPFIAWRIYMLQFPEGIPDTTGLITSIQSGGTVENIFFQPVFFKMMFMDRIGNAIMGIYLISFFIIGAISKFKKKFHFSLLITTVLLLLILQAGNIQYEFFQIMILPTLALITALGIGYTISHPQIFNKVILYPTILVVIGFSFFISYNRVKDYYNYPSDLAQMAKLITTLTSPEDKIVTDTNGDATLLYLSERKGAASIYKEIAELQQDGYSYVVTDKKELTDELRNDGLEVLVENQRFSIIAL